MILATLGVADLAKKKKKREEEEIVVPLPFFYVWFCFGVAGEIHFSIY